MKNEILGNWGLKLLALALALVVYYTMKSETSRHKDNDAHRILTTR